MTTRSKKASPSSAPWLNMPGKAKREPISCSELVIGMKCGGSDGLSGITANPTVGGFSDLLISKGGTTILTEVPEMFGAETLLMNRCENEELFDQTVKLINDFKNYFTSHGQSIYENPSPGNKKAASPPWRTSPSAAPEIRFRSGKRRAFLRRAREKPRPEPAVRSRQRSGGLHRPRRVRRTDRPVHHRTGNALRLPGPHSEDFQQHAAL